MNLRLLSLSTITATSLLIGACGGSQKVSEVVDAAVIEATETAQNHALAAAVANPARSEADRARDVYRHPQETLEFFGLRPDQTVIEIGPGRGWYTQILAPYLAPAGQYIAALHDADGPRAGYRAGWDALVQAAPDTFGAIPVVTFDPGSKIDLGEDNSADLILTFRATHGWITAGAAEEAFAGLFRALKPGGHLGLVQHRALPGADVQEAAKQGYVPQQTVIDLAQAAGFELVEASEINANPNDTTQHPDGVWSLLPTLRGDDEAKAAHAPIGESDRMTLLFRKP